MLHSLPYSQVYIHLATNIINLSLLSLILTWSITISLSKSCSSSCAPILQEFKCRLFIRSPRHVKPFPWRMTHQLPYHESLKQRENSEPGTLGIWVWGSLQKDMVPTLHPAAAQQCEVQMWDERIRVTPLQTATPQRKEMMASAGQHQVHRW